MPEMKTLTLPDGREAVLFLRGHCVWLAVFKRRGEKVGIFGIGNADDVIQAEFPDEQKDLLQGIQLNLDPDERIYLYLQRGGM